jgi:hypothetical protein
MKRMLPFVIMAVLSLTLFMGCKTFEPVVVEKIVAPDLSVFRYDVYELFPLITEPQTDADLMYNNLVNEMDASLTHAYADMLEQYSRTLADAVNR